MSISINVTATPAAPDDPLVFEILSTGSIDGVTAQVTDPGGGTESVYDNGDVAGYSSTSEAITGGLRITVRRLFGWWLGGLSFSFSAGNTGGASVRILPDITGTVGHWPLQSGDLSDASGNGLDLTSVQQGTGVATPVNVVSSLDACISGVDLNFGKTKLVAPSTPLLRLTGEMTIQWLMTQLHTSTVAYFVCAKPSGRSGGISVDRIGSLFTFFSADGNCSVSDEHIGSNIPSPGYGRLSGTNNANWAHAPGTVAAFAVTRDAGGTYRCYRNGILVGSVATAGANTSDGTELFYIGGDEGTGADQGGCQFADVRVLNYARSGSDLAADAVLSMASCDPQSTSATVTCTVGPTTGPVLDQARSRVILQYQNSPKLLKEIDLHATIGQQVMDFFASLPLLDDPDLAGGVNLDVDGEIVGQGRLLSDGTIATDGQYRVLIRMKAARNNARVSSADYLAALVAFFGAKVRLADHGDMAISYVVMREPTADEIAILDEDIVPRPMGVKVTRSWAPAIYFGYAEDPGASGYDVGHYVEGF